MAHLKFIVPDTASEEIREAWEAVRVSRGCIPVPPNLYRTLAHSPGVMKSWSAFAQTIRGYDNAGELVERPDGLNPRLYKLTVLQVARLTENVYEWTLHKRSASIFGVGEAEINQLEKGEFRDFTPAENVALRFTEDVVKRRPTGDTMIELKKLFDERTIVDLSVAISFYVCVATFINALAIEPDKYDGPPEFTLGKSGIKL